MRGLAIFAAIMVSFFISATLILSYPAIWGIFFYWMKTIFWFYFMGVVIKFLYNKLKKEGE